MIKGQRLQCILSLTEDSQLTGLLKESAIELGGIPDIIQVV